jgi:hypothetical protein
MGMRRMHSSGIEPSMIAGTTGPHVFPVPADIDAAPPVPPEFRPRERAVTPFCTLSRVAVYEVGSMCRSCLFC